MVAKKAHEVDSWLRSPDLGVCAILLYGPDIGLVAERAGNFARKTGLPLEDVFSVTRLSHSDLADDPGRLVDEARTVPMFAGKRLVWVRGVPASGPLVEALGDLLAEPPPELWILVEAGDLRKSAKLRTLFERADSAIALPCYNDGAREIDRLIDQELSAASMTIGLEARHALKRMLGGDRLATRGELQKLTLYANGARSIELADVLDAVGDASALGQDAVVDAILRGDPSELDSAFSRLISTAAPPFLSLSAATRQFQQLQQIRGDMEENGKTAAGAVATAKPPIFYSRKSMVEKAISVMDIAFINRALERLHQATLKSRQNPDLAASLVRQALLALSLETSAELRKTGIWQ
jgi:DNA polymerase-3 subunit delta